MNTPDELSSLNIDPEIMTAKSYIAQGVVSVLGKEQKMPPKSIETAQAVALGTVAALAAQDRFRRS